MKKARKPLAVLLAACMLFGSAPASVFASDYDETVDATFDTQETVEETSNVQGDISVAEQEAYDQAAAEEAARLEQEAEAARIAAENQQAMQEAADQQAAEEAARQAEQAEAAAQAAQAQQEAQEQADQETSGAVMGGVDASNSTDDTAVTDTTEETQNPEEDGSVEETHPAFSFYDIMLPDGTVLDIDVPAGALFAGTSLMARTIDLGEGSADPGRAADILSRLSKATGLPEGETLPAGQVKAYEIFFYDGAAGEVPHIQPAKGVTFTLRNLQIEGDTLDVYAIPEITAENPDPAAYKISNAPAANPADGPAAVIVTDNTQFDVIAVVGNVKNDEETAEAANTEENKEEDTEEDAEKETEEETEKETEEKTEEVVLTEQTLTETVDGKQITVSGNLPEGAELQVVAIPLDTAMEMYTAMTGSDEDSTEMLFAYDITLLVNGEKYQPEDFCESVTVAVQNIDSDADAEIGVIHVKTDITDGEGGIDTAAIERILAGDAPMENLEARTEGEGVFFDMTSFSPVLGVLKSMSSISGTSSLTVTYRNIDVDDGPQSFYANVNGTMYITASMPETASDKRIIVTVPTGWNIQGCSKEEGASASGRPTGITIDKEYAHAVVSSRVDPIPGACRYGTVTGTTWANQNLSGYTVRTYGGIITYELDPNAANVLLKVNLAPQPILFPHNVSTEAMPPVTVTLFSEGEETSCTLEATATEIAVQSLQADNRTKNIEPEQDGRSERIEIGGHVSGNNGQTGESTRQSLADEYTVRIDYPVGVFYNGYATKWGTLENYPNEGNTGGGYILMTGKNGVMSHSADSNSKFLLYFYAKTSEDSPYPPEAPVIENGDNLVFTMNGTAKRCVDENGEPIERSIANTSWTRHMVGGNGDRYSITVGKQTRSRRDLKTDFDYDEKYTLVGTNVRCELDYTVTMLLENDGNKLGLTGLGLVGKDIKNITVKTFGSQSRTIQLNSLSGQAGHYSAIGLYSQLGLAEGEYISSCRFTTTLEQIPPRGKTYETTFTTGGISGFGRILNGQGGRINISVLKAGTDEPALNPQDEPITGYAALNIGHSRTGFGQVKNTVSATRDGSQVRDFYPNQKIYYKSVYKNYNSYWADATQHTIINPTIVIAVPEGIELDENSVTAQSAAGNWNGTEFHLVKKDELAPVTLGRVRYKVYRYEGENDKDLVARENWFGIPEKEREITVRYEAMVTPTCPAYTNLSTMDYIGWDINHGDSSLISASDGGGTSSTKFGLGYSVAIEHQRDRRYYFIKPLIGLVMDLQIRPQEGPERWLKWVGDMNSVAKVQEGKNAEVKLDYISMSESEYYHNTDIYIPIPKKGLSYQYLTNVAGDPVNATDVRTFEFDTSLAEKVYMYGEDTEWQTWYLEEVPKDNPVPYVESEDKEHWEPVVSQDGTLCRWTQFPSSLEKVVMVKFHAVDDILPGKSGSATMVLRVADDAEFTKLDYWRAYGRHVLGQDSANWESTNVIAATPTTATLLGKFFLDLDKDAAFGTNDADYTDRKYNAYLSNEEYGIINLKATVHDDGIFEILDGGWPYYLLKGDYTLTIIKDDDENKAFFEKINSDTASSEDSWFNDIKDTEVSGITTATYEFKVNESGNVEESVFVPTVYYVGVGLRGYYLDVKKLLPGFGESTEKEFRFTASLKDASGEPVIGDVATELTVAPETVTFDGNGKYSFTLKKGDNQTFAWLPYGGRFEITEDEQPGYAAFVAIGDEDEEETWTTSGSIEEDTHITVTNKAITEITVVKEWDDDDDRDGKRPKKITVHLLADGNEVEQEGEVVITENEDGEWTHTWKKLPVYNEEEQKIIYTVTEDEIDEYSTTIGDLVENETDDEFPTYSVDIINTHIPEKIDIHVEKIWDDADDQDGLRPERVYVQFLANGETVDSVILDASNEWHKLYTDLYRYENGEEIEYEVTENKVDWYETVIEKVEPEEEGGRVTYEVTITNSHEPETVDIPVQKVWDDKDNQDGVRPDFVILRLLVNGAEMKDEETGEWLEGYWVELDGTEEHDYEVENENVWPYIFEGMPKYDHGHPIRYTVIEDVPSDYSFDIERNAVINTYTPGKTSVTVVKKWDDNFNQDGIRPDSVTVNLLAGEGEDAKVVKTAILTEADGWRYTFTDLDVKKDGKDIVYTVKEELDEDSPYVKGNIEGDAQKAFIIPNSYEPETVSVTAEKVWEDNDDQDGARPEEVTVRLFANGIFRTEETLSESNEWTFTWSGLPKYDKGSEILYTVTEDAVSGYATETTPSADEEGLIFTFTNSYTPGKTSVTVTKSWDDEDDYDGLRPESVEVKLLANDDAIEVEEGEEDPYTVTLSEANRWTYTWTNLPEKADGKDIVYTVEETDVEGYNAEDDQPAITGDATTGYVITNIHEVEKTSISGEKVWDDNVNELGIRPLSITVSLYADGEFVAARTVTEANNWAFDFGKLPVYAKGSGAETPIVYTIVEDAVEGYKTTYETNDEAEGAITFTVTNTPVTTTSVSVKKVWDDGNNRDGVRPDSVLVDLMAGDEVIGTAGLNAANGWYYVWEGLDKENAEGEEIEYTVAEQTDDDGKVGVYTAGSAEKLDAGAADVNYEITNSYTPETVEIKGLKIWDDADNQDGKRPESIELVLYANGQLVNMITVSEEDGNIWPYSFTEDADGNPLPAYKNGQPVTYTVLEMPVEDYTTTYDGYFITNRYTPGKTSVTVLKVWDDDNDRDGIRPETVQINLYADGQEAADSDTPEPDLKSAKAGEADPETTEPLQTANAGAGNAWMVTFTDLDAMSGGEEIVYTVEEVLPEDSGYEMTSMEQAAKNSWVITNSHDPETVNVSGKKTWDDADDQDGKRPEEIKVRLLANGAEQDVKTVKADDDWAYEWTGLNKYEKGREIAYTITEDSVSGYATKIEGYDITNSYTPGKTSVTVTKRWEDEDDYEGLRPESVTVILTGTVEEDAAPDNGTEAEDLTWTAELSEENSWTYTFTDLPEYQGGKPVTYTVEEASGAEETEPADEGGEVDPADEGGDDASEGKEEAEESAYTAVITGDQVTGFIITNTHEVVYKNVYGEVIWDDLKDEDGIRPSSVIITLYADGVEVASKMVQLAADAEDTETPWPFSFLHLPVYKAGSAEEMIDYEITQNAVYDYKTTIVKGTKAAQTEDASEDTSADATEAAEDESLKTADGSDPETTGETGTTDNTGNDGAGDAADTGDTGADEGTDAGADEGAETQYDDYFTVTNVHRPERVTISGQKIWEDDSNRDGVRPESITVYLYADGSYVASQELTAKNADPDNADVWNYEFTDLKKYNSHNETIRYSVSEKAVKDYTMSLNGYNITNKHTPGKTFVSVIKVWSDNANANKTRPESITVRLYADGKEIAHQTLSSQTGWFHVFTDLDTKNGGKEIAYTITEDDVTGYESVITGSASEGYMINNKLIETPEKDDEKEKEKEKETEKEKEKEKEKETSKTTTGGGGTPGGGGAPGGGDGGKIAPVKTGDDTPIGLYVTLLLIGLAALTGVILAVRKRRRS